MFKEISTGRDEEDRTNCIVLHAQLPQSDNPKPYFPKTDFGAG